MITVFLSNCDGDDSDSRWPFILCGLDPEDGRQPEKRPVLAPLGSVIVGVTVDVGATGGRSLRTVGFGILD